MSLHWCVGVNCLAADVTLAGGLNGSESSVFVDNLARRLPILTLRETLLYFLKSSWKMKDCVYIGHAGE